MTDESTDGEKSVLLGLSDEDFAIHLALGSLNLETLESDDDVGFNGRAAHALSQRLRRLIGIENAAQEFRRYWGTGNGSDRQARALFVALDKSREL